MGIAHAALDFEGQSGVFLNALAYPLGANKVEVGGHYLSLNSLGQVDTFNLGVGLKKNLELGYTELTTTVDGLKNQNILSAKWQAVAEKKDIPAVAVWAQARHQESGSGSTDLGVSVTKVISGDHPIILDLGARRTKALGIGLFGFNHDYKTKLEGVAAVFVTKKLIVGTEFKQQINSKTWTDIAARYVVNNHFNLDAGIADLGPGLGNQIALAATWSL